MSDNETVVMVFHPGYLDDFVLTHSSLTFNRTKEVDALIDPKLKEWFLDEYKWLDDVKHLEVLWNNTDFGVGD